MVLPKNVRHPWSSLLHNSRNACSFGPSACALAPIARFHYWQGGSTARLFHYRTWAGDFAAMHCINLRPDLLHWNF